MVVELLGLSGVAGSGKDFIANIIVSKYQFIKVAFADPIKRVCQDIFDFSDDQLWGPSERRNEPDRRYPRPVNVDGEHYSVKEDDQGNVEVTKGDDPPIMMTFQEWEALRNHTGFLTPRYALQKLGTEWGRDCYEHIWIDYTIRVSKRLIEDPFKYLYNAKAGLTTATCDVLHPPKGVIIPDVRFKNEIEAVRQAGGKIVRLYGRPTSLSEAASNHASEREQLEIPDMEFDYVMHNTEDASLLLKSIRRMMVNLA